MAVGLVEGDEPAAQAGPSPGRVSEALAATRHGQCWKRGMNRSKPKGSLLKGLYEPGAAQAPGPSPAQGARPRAERGAGTAGSGLEQRLSAAPHRHQTLRILQPVLSAFRFDKAIGLLPVTSHFLPSNVFQTDSIDSKMHFQQGAKGLISLFRDMDKMQCTEAVSAV